MFKLRILHQNTGCVRPAGCLRLCTFEFCNNEPPTVSAAISSRLCCELACSFNGVRIELADFGVGIVEIQGVFWVTTMSCSSGTSLKQVIFMISL